MTPNASLTEEDVWDVLVRLHKIKHKGNPDSDSLEAIAKTYKVNKKTISRIQDGKTWRSVKLRFDSDPDYRVDSPVMFLQSYPDETLNLLEDVPRAKTRFGLAHDKPLYYGRFDGYDGVHWVVTDGMILWESQSLYHLAVKIAESGIKEHPLYAAKVEELPTFEIAALMTFPFEDKLVEREDFNTGVSRLTSEAGHPVLLRAHYMHLYDRDRFDAYLVGDRKNFVYFTKTKTTRNSEHTVIHAVVATMEIT